MKHIEDKYLKIFFTGIALLIFYKILDNISWFVGLFNALIDAFFPVILALIIVFFAYGPASRIEKKIKTTKNNFLQKQARKISLLVVYIAIILLFSVLIRFLLPAIYENLSILAKNLPEYLETIKNWLSNIDTAFKSDLFNTVTNQIKSLLSMENIIASFSAIYDFLSSILNLFTALILSVYILADRENVLNVGKKAVRFILKTRYERFSKLVKNTSRLFYSYFTGLALDAAIIGVITALFLTIIGSPYAILLGFIVCIGNLIPFFGSIVAAVFVFILSAVSFGPIKSIWILLFQLALGQLDGNFIQPRIISRSVNLSPIWILLSVLVFGNLFGPIGMIIGTPLVASMELVIKAIKEEKRLLEEADSEEQS